MPTPAATAEVKPPVAIADEKRRRKPARVKNLVRAH
jgi:hypothetical protein